MACVAIDGFVIDPQSICMPSSPPPPPKKKTISHIEVGFKWMWILLATPNKLVPAVVDLCAGLALLLPRQINHFHHGFFSSAVLDWSLRSCLRVKHLLRQQITDNRQYLRWSFQLQTSSLRSQNLAVEALVRLLIKGKLHSKIISSDMIEFFSVESNGEGPRSKFEREDGQTDGGKLAHASICDVMVPHWCHLAIMARSRDWIKIFVISRNQPASSDDMMAADTTMTAIIISNIIVAQSSHEASNLDQMSQKIFVTFWYL